MDHLTNYTDVIALVVSIIAFVWALITGRKLKGQQRLLNEQQRVINEFTISNTHQELENSKKADISIFAFNELKRYTITVSNSGAAIAKNIRIDWKDYEKEGFSIFIQEDNKLPYPQLNNKESFAMYAFMVEQRRSTLLVEVFWDDEYRIDNRKEIVISF